MSLHNPQIFHVKRYPHLVGKFIGLLILMCSLYAVSTTRTSAEQTSIFASMSKLTTHTGKPFDSTMIDNQLTLLAFGFTNCPDICPMELSRIGLVLKKNQTDAVGGMFVTLDPARDTADKLGKYVPYFSPEILGITGSPEGIQRLADKVGVKFSKYSRDGASADTYSIDHSTGIYVVDQNGTIEAIAPFGSSASQLEKLVTQVLKNKGY